MTLKNSKTREVDEVSDKRDLIIASERISERSFEKIWDNEEDAVYDTL